jgi:hypothetical protein
MRKAVSLLEKRPFSHRETAYRSKQAKSGIKKNTKKIWFFVWFALPLQA